MFRTNKVYRNGKSIKCIVFIFTFLLAILAISSTLEYSFADQKDEGMCGTCKWTYENGVLIINEGTLPSLNVYVRPTWSAHEASITKVILNGTVKASEKTYQLFPYKTEKIIGLENLDMSQTTSAYRMFYNSHLEEIDLRYCKATNLQEMSMMFEFCKSLRRVYLGDYSVRNQQVSVGYLFDGCDMLEYLSIGSGYEFDDENCCFPVQMKDSDSIVYNEGDKLPCKKNEYFFTTKPSINDATITGIEDVTYTGNENKLHITVKLNGRILKDGKDYTVSYTDNVYPGPATVNINGIGHYSGSVERTFLIEPPEVGFTKIKAETKNLRVYWNSQGDAVAGYQIYYDRPYYAGKTITIEGGTVNSKLITGLARDDTYNLKIRSYCMIDGEKQYSPWSKVSKARTSHKKCKKPKAEIFWIHINKYNAKIFVRAWGFISTDRFDFYLRKGKGKFKKIGSSEDGDLYYSKPLKWSTKYSIKVKAIDKTYKIKKYSKVYTFKTPKKSGRKRVKAKYKKYIARINKLKDKLSKLKKERKQLKDQLNEEKRLHKESLIEYQNQKDKKKKEIYAKAETIFNTYTEELSKLYKGCDGDTKDNRDLINKYRTIVSQSYDVLQATEDDELIDYYNDYYMYVKNTVIEELFDLIYDYKHLLSEDNGIIYPVHDYLEDEIEYINDDISELDYEYRVKKLSGFISISKSIKCSK